MGTVELTEAFLAKIAGWEAMKKARGILASGWVHSSNWTPPILKGVVQEGSISYRAGLAIKDSIDIENMCSCRNSRQWGTICAHSVAVGLHHLRRNMALSPLTSSDGAPVVVKPAGLAGRMDAATTSPKRTGRRIQRATEGEVGEPLEIFVIFPPNLSQAIARGKIMICLEGQWRGGRVPLNAIPLMRPFHLSRPDGVLLDALEELAGGETPALMQLQLAQFADLLSKLIDHPRLTLGKSQPAEVLQTAWKMPLKAVLAETGEIQLEAKPASQVVPMLVGERGWVLSQTTLQPLGLPKAYWEVLNGPIRLPRSRVPQFLGQDWPAVQAGCELEANFRLDQFTLGPLAPRFVLALAGGLAQLQAQLQCAYGPRIMTLGVTSKEETVWLPDPQCVTRYSTRNLPAEQSAQARLLRAGFAGPDVSGQFRMTGQSSVLNFFARDYPRLRKEWEVTLEERLERSTAQNLDRIEPSFQITSSGEQWFDMEVAFTTQTGERFSAAEIQRLVLSGQSHQRLKNGRIALIDTAAVAEFQETLLDCNPQQNANGFRLSNAQAGFLDATLREQAGWKVQAPPQWRERVDRQHGEIATPTPFLGELENVLRPYQKHGVAWLDFLRQNDFGGILADEMGLGKTLQTLAFLQALKLKMAQLDALGKGGQDGRPSLVVCPTSLVSNWVAEAKKFTPSLTVLAIQGPARQALFSQIPQHDLVVTSYALIRRDADLYRSLEFDVAVLDEAQHIKNRQTQNAQAVKAVRAGQRMVLTGTPLENSVLDLWSIFDFLMPGYLGSAQDFRERYEMPISREKNTGAQARLARRLRPFLLRRLKRDVAPELPDKLEQVSYCDLTQYQAAVYRQVLEASRQEIVQAVESQGLAKNRMLIFTALLRLRQICCDLRLLKLEDIDPATASGKLDLFRELLEEVIDGGHRALVFSQFVSMLSLLRDQLTTDGVEFCYLDGSTTNRAEVVERFQKNDSIPVFLISLKAGGLGLNLTGADTVIHFDPWWNPAVEDQATDRAHRIGQTRVVTSYRLITRGTVEEKILHLQTRKRDMIAAALGTDGEVGGALSWDEIQELLRDS